MPQVKDFNRYSRFSVDSDFKVVSRQGISIGTIVTLPQPIRGSDDSIFIVPLQYENRWDLICRALFDNVDYKWILMRHNKIKDPFIGPLAGDRLLIPSLNQIRYYLGQ
jgi:hypothetical protein